MRPDQARELLDNAIPGAPATTGWANRVEQRIRRRRLWAAAAAVAMVIVAVPAGMFLSTRSTIPATPVPADSAPADPGEVTGNVAIYQYQEEDRPHLCLGMVLTSLPPQCGGPTLLGDFSWEDMPHNDVSGTRWTDDSYTVRGRYDADDDSFTLTHPIVPAPVAEPGDQGDGEGLSFPTLCDDPLRGADQGPVGMENTDRLLQEAEKLPLVGIWVSNGSDAFEVLVRGDAEAAHARLRTVWGGKLCVASSDAATEAERVAAMERIQDALPDGSLTHASGGSGVDPVVEVGVVHLDDATEQMILEAAGEGIGVRIDSVFTPVGE